MPWSTGESQVTVRIKGEELNFSPSEVTAEKIISIAKESGLGKFTVKVNGNEVSSPSEFTELKGGDIVELIPYDEWGV